MSIEKEPITFKLQRVFAIAAAVVSIIAVVSFLIWIIAVFFGLPQEALATGWWPALAITAWIGLPTGFVFLLLVLVISWVSGDRESAATVKEQKRSKIDQNIAQHYENLRQQKDQDNKQNPKERNPRKH